MRRSLVVTAGLMLLSAVSLRAQDAAVVNPKTIHVTLDNERVRVFEASLPPGWKENMHSHPTSIVYVIVGGTVRNHLPDGTVSEPTRLSAGQTLYRAPITAHWTENVGKTTIRLVVVELKPQPTGGTGPVASH
jgi:mannose-6-phosphate isomerase-like protein (cupin superfamily)